MTGGGDVSYHRQSCPGRIFEDLGVGFSIGCIGGSLYYFIKGTTLSSIINFHRPLERPPQTTNHGRPHPR